MLEPIDLNSVISVSDSALSADVGGELVILDPEAGKYFNLNAVGAEIWRRLQQATTPARLIADLVAHYQGPEDAIRQDTLELLHHLADKGLLTVATPPG